MYRQVLSTVKSEEFKFGAAFLPYTEMGKLVVSELSKPGKVSEAAARDKVRQVPAIVPTHY